jgi:hypothetical protein
MLMAKWAVADRPYSSALQLVVREMDETPQNGVVMVNLKVESDRSTVSPPRSSYSIDPKERSSTSIE